MVKLRYSFIALFGFTVGCEAILGDPFGSYRGVGGAGGEVGDCPTAGTQDAENCWTLERESALGPKACAVPARYDDALVLTETPDVDDYAINQLLSAPQRVTVVGTALGSKIDGLLADSPLDRAFLADANIAQLTATSAVGFTTSENMSAIGADTAVVMEGDRALGRGAMLIGTRKGQPDDFSAPSLLRTAFAQRYVSGTPDYLIQNPSGRSRFVAATTALSDGKESLLRVAALQLGPAHASDENQLARMELLYFSDGEEAPVARFIGPPCGEFPEFGEIEAFNSNKRFPLDIARSPTGEFFVAGTECEKSLVGRGFVRRYNALPDDAQIPERLFTGDGDHSVTIAGVETMGPLVVVAGTFQGTLRLTPEIELFSSEVSIDAFIAVYDHELTLVAHRHFGGYGDVAIKDFEVVSRPIGGKTIYAAYLGGSAEGDIAWGCDGDQAPADVSQAILAKVLLGEAENPRPDPEAIYVKRFGSVGESSVEAIGVDKDNLWVAFKTRVGGKIDLTPQTAPDDAVSVLGSETQSATILVKLDDDDSVPIANPSTP